MIWNVVGSLVKGGLNVMKTQSETKQIKALAEQKHYQRMEAGEVEYQVAAQKNMKDSWRDEWFTVILSMPLLLIFGSILLNKPEWITKLKEGFEVLNQLPEWYIYALLAAIASSFGLKVTDLAIKKFKK